MRQFYGAVFLDGRRQGLARTLLGFFLRQRLLFVTLAILGILCRFWPASMRLPRNDS